MRAFAGAYHNVFHLKQALPSTLLRERNKRRLRMTNTGPPTYRREIQEHRCCLPKSWGGRSGLDTQAAWFRTQPVKSFKVTAPRCQKHTNKYQSQPVFTQPQTKSTLGEFSGNCSQEISRFGKIFDCVLSPAARKI